MLQNDKITPNKHKTLLVKIIRVLIPVVWPLSNLLSKAPIYIKDVLARFGLTKTNKCCHHNLGT